MKKHQKTIEVILSALFGYLVATYTKGSYLGILIIVTTFLIIYLFKKFILNKYI